MCVCVCAGVVCEEFVQYYDNIIIISEVVTYISVAHVKLGVLILVGEIRHYRNSR